MSQEVGIGLRGVVTWPGGDHLVPLKSWFHVERRFPS